MSGVKMIFFILVFLLGGLWETEAVSVTGVVGEEVTIKCSHSNAFTNVKYFCKGGCGDEDILIRSRPNERNEKYSIKDEGNTFSVTISRLTEDDSGTYWCGIERTGKDTYNEVVLTVIQGNNPDNDSLQSNSKASSSKRLVYIGAGLGVALLALAMVLLIFFRHRKKDIHAASGKDPDTVYATPVSQKQDGHHITASSSTANEDQKTDCTFSSSTAQHRDTSRDHIENIYSNVPGSSESQVQPDGLFYSTVSFNKHTGGSAVTPPTAALTYSSIKHKATDESVGYDNV